MRAGKVNTQLQLVATQKGNLSITEYVHKMWSLADEMAVAGRVIEEEELVEYILTGLGQEYDPIVSAVIAQTSHVSISDLYL
jgi:hypothetical protein